MEQLEVAVLGHATKFSEFGEEILLREAHEKCKGSHFTPLTV